MEKHTIAFLRRLNDDLLSKGFYCMALPWRAFVEDWQCEKPSATTYLPSECFLFDLISLVWLFSTSLGLFFLECWDWPSINHLWLQPFSIIEIFFFLLKRKLLQCYASCPFKTIIAWHLCPSDSLTNMWAGTVPCWQMGVSVGSQETMYLHLVYLLRAGFPVGDVQTSVHPELSRLWIKGCHR